MSVLLSAAFGYLLTRLHLIGTYAVLTGPAVKFRAICIAQHLAGVLASRYMPVRIIQGPPQRLLPLGTCSSKRVLYAQDIYNGLTTLSTWSESW